MSADEYPVPPTVVGRGAVFVGTPRSPRVSESAYIAPTAVLAGDVTVGPHSRVLFGAVVRPGESRGPHVCELVPSLPDTSAL